MSWDYFFCEIDGEAATITADLDLAAPQEQLPILVYMRVEHSRLFRVTLEPGDEARKFEEIEGAIRSIAAQHHAVYAGRSSTAKARVYVFYDAEGRQLKNRLERKFKSLEAFGFAATVGIGRDPAWTVYRDFLSPGPKERAAMAARGGTPNA